MIENLAKPSTESDQAHANITTTQRYMHLSPAAIEGAIRLLDGPVGGEMGEARKGATDKLLG